MAQKKAKKVPQDYRRRCRCQVCKVDRTFAGPICPVCVAVGYHIKENGKVGRTPTLPTETEIGSRIEETNSDVAALLKENGERGTAKNMREAHRDLLGDVFFQDAWTDEMYADFDRRVKKVLKTYFPGR